MTVPTRPGMVLFRPSPWNITRAILIYLGGGGFLWWVALQVGSTHGIILRLGHGETEERIAACQALGQLNWREAEAALPDLVRALNDPERLVRREVVDTLARISARSEFVLSALIGALGDEDERVRARAALALGMLGEGSPLVAPALVETLTDSSPDVRAAASAALSALEQQWEHSPDPE